MFSRLRRLAEQWIWLTGLSLAVCVGFLALPASAVIPSGTIVGTVNDASGAVVPGARVTVINQGTNQSRMVQASDTGAFNFPLLPVGTYTLKVEKEGFEAFVQKDIILQVDQNVTLPVVLQLGAINQTVNVVGTPAEVNLLTATVSHVVDEQRIVDLPLNGRDTLQLQFVMPGVSYDNNNVAHGQGQEEGVTVNGNRPGSDYYLLDGIDLTDNYLAVAATFPSPDALQEFDIQTSDFNAQWGRNAGGLVNVVTKTGTNAWHGDLFEFLRNTSLNANNYFANAAGQARPPFHLNQFGGTIGGPIKKDKTFVFGYFQETRKRKSEATTVPTVLTSQERPDINNGVANFSDICPGSTCPIDPRTGATFPNFTIPANRLDPTAVNFIKGLMPIPNSGHSYEFSAPQVGPLDDLDEYQFVVRVDHTVNESNKLFGRYYYNNDTSNGLGAGDNIPGTNHDKLFRNQNVALNWTHTFSPTLLNSATVGFTRLGHFRSPTKSIAWRDFGGPPFASSSGLAAQATGDMYVNISGSLTSSGDGVFRQNRQTYQYSDTLNWVKGRHTLAVGGDFRKESINRFEDYFTDPTFSFNGQFTQNALADLLLGLPSSFRQDTEVRSELRHSALDIYATDSFKMKSNFTVDLGVRWEPYLPPVDNLNDQLCFDPTFTKKSTFYPTAPPGVLYPGPPHGSNFGTGDAGCPRELIPKRWANFAPRIGFNWDPFKNGKTSIRAGYGIFWDQIRLIGYNRFSTAQPFDFSANFTSPGNPSNNFAPSLTGTSVFTNSGQPNPYPFILPRTAGQRAAYNPIYGGNWPSFALEDVLNPAWNEAYIGEWNFTVQRELFNNYSLSVAYIGNKATHLPVSREYNWSIALPLCENGVVSNCETAAQQRADENQRRRFGSVQHIMCNTATPGVRAPCYGPFEMEDVGLWSNYNSLQISLNRKFAHGLEFLGSYVWGKYLDVFSFEGEGSTGPRDPYNLGLDYGPSDNDVRHRFVISYIWQVPKFGHFSGLTNQLVNGWEFQGITTIQSGSPFSVYSGIDTSLSGIGQDHADRVAGQSPTFDTGRPHGQLISEYFNTQAFRFAADGTFGNVGRNMLTGPGIQNFDFSIFKNFPISERWGRIEFRNEYFNLFNHPNFMNPNNSVSSGSAFGTITSARDPRFIQFALKWVF